MVLVIDSPGGGVTGGVALHDAIESFSRHKPVAVSMQGLAASAGYMIAVPAQRIFAYPSTITGSIGVIMMRPDASVLLGRIGISAEAIASGPMKDQSQPFTALKPEGRQMLQGIVDDLFDQFVTMVSRGRHRPVDEIRSLSDGRPYTGRQAIPLHLIDAIGDEDQATAWLKGQVKGAKDLPVRKLAADKPPRTLWERLHHRFGGSWFGLPEALEQVAAYQTLDGAVSILPR
ncbi:signal peptide peptidase sppA [Asaia krungthepensis NRIC 0535]|uniref:Signal peptide peptidase sppA n=2 Tax=Asaia krungthepensis TaxID=220990 RepID=A0ABQ0Q1S3_9PROT|nr:signal peptide peptidase sppA [Asaia krungthepensis NRIC 0535]